MKQLIEVQKLIDARVGLKKDGDKYIGRDPKNMLLEELEMLGHRKKPILNIIRDRCINCCANQKAEVKKCSIISCPSWPYRMGTNPWREKTEFSVEHRKKANASLAKARESRK